MSRCYCCDSTSDGYCTLVPFRKSRTFEVDRERPWLEICSDCSSVNNYDDALSDELQDMAVMDGRFDD